MDLFRPGNGKDFDFQREREREISPDSWLTLTYPEQLDDSSAHRVTLFLPALFTSAMDRQRLPYQVSAIQRIHKNKTHINMISNQPGLVGESLIQNMLSGEMFRTNSLVDGTWNH